MEKKPPLYGLDPETGRIYVVPEDDGGMVLVFGALCAVSGFLVGVLVHILWGFL